MRNHSGWVTAASAVLVVLGMLITSGCGSGDPEVDKSALYTPESLAEELAFRYRALKPDARKSVRGGGAKGRSARTAKAIEQANAASKKESSGEIPKRSGPPTLDDLMADIDAKVGKVFKTTRAEVCKKMIESIAQDSSLTADDKKVLTEQLEGLGSS